jgi:hypothetical protein
MSGWRVLAKGLRIPAQPSASWTLAIDHVAGPALLKIEAEGKWRFADRSDAGCGPDGVATSHLPGDRCLVAAAPVGALVGKLGGSTVANDGVLHFPVGRHCVIELTATQRGPLYLTINDFPGGFDDNGGEVTVRVERLPVPAAGAAAG